MKILKYDEQTITNISIALITLIPALIISYQLSPSSFFGFVGTFALAYGITIFIVGALIALMPPLCFFVTIPVWLFLFLLDLILWLILKLKVYLAQKAKNP